MEPKKKIQTVIWAVDPFMNERSLQRSAAKALRSLLGEASIRVEPVYVMNVSKFLIPFAYSDVVGDTAKLATRRLEPVVRGLGMRSVAPVKVLSDVYTGRQGEVSALWKYARERGADLILISTHGRKGLGRWIMGSFAETLMASSPIPLLVVNPHWKTRADFRDVFFPTDFSEESERVFDLVLDQAKSRSGRVTIYHHLPNLNGPEIPQSILNSPAYRQATDRAVNERKALAERWLKLAAERGVHAKAIIDSKTQGSDAEAILKRVRRDPALIAMAARSGRLASTLLGSTTRQVLRGATVPVWVVHDSKTLSKSKPLFEISQEDVDANLIDHESPVKSA